MNTAPCSIILAAGLSTRMGRSKASLPLGRETFLSRILRTHLELDLEPVTVLSGIDRDALRTVRERKMPVLINPDPEKGPLSSIRLALPLLIGTRTGVLIHPVDHPLVLKETLALLLAAHRAFPHRILLPAFQGKKGHPVLFPDDLCRELLEGPLEEGARWVVRRHPDRLHRVPVSDPGIHRNIDTPGDYRRWAAGLSK